MTALALAALLAIAALVAWRWWLTYAAAQRQADRESALAIARAAPEKLGQLEAQLMDLRKRLDDDTWAKPRR